MKKRWIFLISLVLFAFNLQSSPWAYEGNDLSGHFKGDLFSIYYTMNSDGWNCTSKDIGLGQTDSDAGLNWTSVTWDNQGGDGDGGDEGVRIDVQVTSTGTWYYSLRCDSYYHDHSWSENGWNEMITNYDSDYFNVSSLNNPTLNSAAKHGTYSSTKLNLSVSEDAQEHNVLIVRREGADITWTPTDGTSYSGGDDLGNNTIVINGSWDITDGSHTQTFLDEYYDIKPGTTYYYKTFTENNSYYSSGSSSSSVTTDALPKPASASASMLSDSKLKIEWTPNGTYGEVMIVAREGSDLSSDPSNGTEYNVSDPLGDGSVIFKGSGSSHIYTELDANTTYYFRLYTVEDYTDYYSATDINTSVNATTHDGNTYHSIEFTGNTNDFSADENVGGNYYLTWDDTYLYVAEFIDIDLTSTANKFVIAIDKDPGTINGYAPPDWGGYNFAANNDGTHNLEYIFAMGGSFTNLYNSGDNFFTPADKSGYTKHLGNHAEVAIPWSDLGGRPTSDWAIIMWFANAANTWMDSAWPSSNPTSGTFPLEVEEMHIFGSAGSGIKPDESGGATPLPVTLSSFTAVYDGEVPVLNWVTASEINNAGWNVYRSESDDLSLSLQINPELIEGQGTTSSSTNYEFIDLYGCDQDKAYYYWLESLDHANHTDSYGPISLYIPLPEDENNNSPCVFEPYGLHQNYPNPFNPATEISFTLNYSSPVSLAIYDFKGKKIRTLLQDQPVGKDDSQFLIWDGTNNEGNLCSSGIYIYRMTTNREVRSRRMLLIK